MARKKYVVETTDTAESDMLEIHDRIARDRPRAADLWVQEIKRQVRSLETMPECHEVIPESEELGVEYRHIVSGNDRTIYRIEGKRVIVLRDIHGARLLDPFMFSE